MNCEILHTLYVRSNGDVPCNDDAGESVLLGRIRQDDRWTVDSLLFNHRYRHIRTALVSGRMPWPDVCPTCAFFRPNEPYVDHLAHKWLRKIQVEPSLACRLRCPGCSNGVQARVRPGPLQMEVGLFERLLDAMKQAQFAIGEFEYCGQGEPLLHPRFPEFVRLVTEYFPLTHQRLITSGNFDYAATLGTDVPREIMVSCDGVYASSYERYRMGGLVHRPIQFMRDAVRGLGGASPTVIWKYILFEWNDRLDEIAAAQELAQEIGVAALLFVYTHSVGKSKRYTLDNRSEFPIHHPNVVTNATPVHYRESDEPVSLPATPGALAGVG